MASYKEGNERLSQTGGGMDGPELITYQEWVTKNVCKYYFELDDVLKNRPNVRPWFTNEKVMKPKDRLEKIQIIRILIIPYWTTVLLTQWNRN